MNNNSNIENDSLKKYFTKSIEFPTSWDDVTLEQYDAISTLNVNDEFYTANLVSILSRIPINDVLAFPVTNYSTLVDKLSFLNEMPRKYIPSDNITIGDMKFNVCLAPQKLSAGQFLDYKTLLNADIDRKTARLMMCFMIPEGHTYNDGYDVEKMLDIIHKNMTVVEVTAYTNFFMELYKAYTIATLQYSVKQTKKDKKIPKEQKKFLIERMKETIAIIKSGGCFQ